MKIHSFCGNTTIATSHVTDNSLWSERRVRSTRFRVKFVPISRKGWYRLTFTLKRAKMPPLRQKSDFFTLLHFLGEYVHPSNCHSKHENLLTVASLEIGPCCAFPHLMRWAQIDILSLTMFWNSRSWHLKTVYTIGNCQTPVFSLGVSQHMHKITNLWKFELDRSSELQDNYEKKNTLVCI